MSERKRPQLTVGEVMDHLSKCDRSLPMFAAPSMLNTDEPEETQEFIYDDNKMVCVAVEFSSQYATLGFIET